MRVFLMDRKLNVSDAYLRPGFAFGGSCLPKDLRALLHAARAADVALPVLSSILPSNDAQVRREVCAGLAYLGINLDTHKNTKNAEIISAPGSACTVRVIRTNEDLMIARHTRALLFSTMTSRRG